MVNSFPSFDWADDFRFSMRGGILAVKVNRVISVKDNDGSGVAAGTDAQPMLEFLRGKVSDRKLRLFACGCCYQHDVFLFIPKAISRRPSVQVSEQFADGLVSEQVLRKARRQEERQWDRNNNPHFSFFVIEGDAFSAAKRTALFAHSLYKEYEGERAAEKLQKAQANLIRCVFGNPIRPVVLDRTWLSWNAGTVPKLAKVLYEERSLPSCTLDNERLTVLADALEEAGCTNADILAHCRMPGEHVRGCWVVDLLLGKK
jgi:hypothetical protein